MISLKFLEFSINFNLYEINVNLLFLPMIFRFFLLMGEGGAIAMKSEIMDNIG